MNNLFQDLRYGFRMMLKSPGFTSVAILSLALGIGANTAIFSAINSALLKPPPYKEPDRLMLVQRTNPESPDTPQPWSYPKFEVMRDNNTAFEQVAAFSKLNFPLTDSDNPERLEVEIVSASYFPLLGIEAISGRTFLPEEDQTPDTHPVALIGHGLWQRRFGANPNILGQTISLNRVPFTIVGILPQGFKGESGSAEVWVPMMMAPSLTFARRLQTAFAHWHDVIARLKPGVSYEQAQAEMALVQKKIDEAIPWPAQWGPAPEQDQLRAMALTEAKVDPAFRKSFLILFAAVGFVLLIACLNIANLLTSRAVSRKKEVAIRLALGASRSRLVRQLLTESVLLSFLGGAIGLLVALWGIEILTAFKPVADKSSATNIIQAIDFSSARLDGQVLGFNFLLSFITGMAFGLVPALRATKPDVNETLKEGAGSSTIAVRTLSRIGPRNLIVVAEIAIALVLLVGAGLLIRSFARLQAIPIGFDPSELLTLRVQLPKKTPEAFYEQLLNRISATQGVQSATVASSTPLSSNFAKANMKIEENLSQSEGNIAVGVHSVGPDHFKTLRIPVMKGRSFTDRDREGSPRVAILNETAARQYWPNEDPIGKRIWLSIGWEKDDFAEIIGVVGDVKYGHIDEAARPDVYLPYLQPTEPSSYVIIRTNENPAAMAGVLRQAVLAVDRNVPVYDIRTMEDRIGDATSRARFSALLLGIFASLALALSAIGIYGVMGYLVSGRTREIGIRMALGADRRDVLKLVMRDGIILTIAGLAIGIAASLGAARILASQLYGVGTTDSATYIGVSLVLAAVALAATYIPARRAANVDPSTALRYE